LAPARQSIGVTQGTQTKGTAMSGDITAAEAFGEAGLATRDVMRKLTGAAADIAIEFWGLEAGNEWWGEGDANPGSYPGAAWTGSQKYSGNGPLTPLGLWNPGRDAGVAWTWQVSGSNGAPVNLYNSYANRYLYTVPTDRVLVLTYIGGRYSFLSGNTVFINNVALVHDAFTINHSDPYNASGQVLPKNDKVNGYSKDIKLMFGPGEAVVIGIQPWGGNRTLIAGYTCSPNVIAGTGAAMPK
jgi:hypothetical protein